MNERVDERQTYEEKKEDEVDRGDYEWLLESEEIFMLSPEEIDVIEGNKLERK